MYHILHCSVKEKVSLTTPGQCEERKFKLEQFRKSCQSTNNVVVREFMHRVQNNKKSQRLESTSKFSKQKILFI